MSARIWLVCLLLTAAGPAFADAAGDCQAAGGAYRTGVVTADPHFAHGKPLKGTELSHTHFSVKADQDGQTYDVAADNVYASGYDKAGEAVPEPLTTIHQGDHVALCGELYTGGDVGIHWVHGNCGAPPTPKAPNGYLELIGANGKPGENLEGSSEYCKLWE
jgi:hypothetical protein